MNNRLNVAIPVPSIPYYKQLGYSSSVDGIRQILEKRMGLYGTAIRIEIVVYMEKEGKSREGCPIAKSVVRRSSDQEVVLALVRYRKGHKCSAAYIVVSIVVWDAIDSPFADKLYDIIVYKVNEYGISTQRRCAQNDSKTCGCQGLDGRTNGACYSYGCSWSMFRDGCKFRDSQRHNVRKFRLTKRHQESELEYHLQTLATGLVPLYKAIAPDAYNNQVTFEREGSECRIGYGKGRPFSGVTACLDFCAHSHKDLHNMQNGSTVVVTLTKHRGSRVDHPLDEQLHVLPMYSIACFDEFGSIGQQLRKIAVGSVEVLNKFPQIKRIFSKPGLSCRKARHMKCKTRVGATDEPKNRNKNGEQVVDSSTDTTEVMEYYSDNEYCFEDQSMGGLAIALTHRSVLFECAKHEIHATTGLRHPNRTSPSRISLVLYQHRALNHYRHGFYRHKSLSTNKKNKKELKIK